MSQMLEFYNKILMDHPIHDNQCYLTFTAKGSDEAEADSGDDDPAAGG